MHLLLFGFNGTVGEQVVKALAGSADVEYLDSTTQALDTFIAQTDFTRYDYVLGCGMYSGRGEQALRIETRCSNQFRKVISPIERLAIPYFLHPDTSIVLAASICNSWCNRISYQILQKAPGTAYSFVHIPKRFDPMIATSLLRQQLQALEN
jgi:hypothetical protein